MKFCAACASYKDLQEFGKDSRTQCGLKSYCKECRKIENRLYYIVNKEKRLSQLRKHKDANASYYDDYAKKYRLANKEMLLKKSRAYYRENRMRILRTTSEWARNNKGRRAQIDSKRRFRKLNQLGKVRPDITNILLVKQNNLCYYCFSDIDIGAVHLEHKIPLSRGGLHDEGNLVVSCPTCNFRKGSKTDLEYLGLLNSGGIINA